MFLHKVNLHLSRSDSLGSSSSALDRASSFTDFAGDTQLLNESPVLEKAQESQPSLQKVKNLLQKASEKLHFCPTTHTELTLHQEISEKNKEIAYLKNLAKQLESEK